MRPLPLVLQSRYYLSSVCYTPVLLLALHHPAVLARSCCCSREVSVVMVGLVPGQRLGLICGLCISLHADAPATPDLTIAVPFAIIVACIAFVTAE